MVEYYSNNEIRQLLRKGKKAWSENFKRMVGAADFIKSDRRYNWKRINEFFPKDKDEYWKITEDGCYADNTVSKYF